MRLLFFYLLFVGTLFDSQISKDTLRKMRNPDCTEFNKENQKYYDQLIEESKETDYSGLAKLIVENISRDSLKTDKLKLYLRKNRTVCGNEIDFSICYSKINVTNPLYGESLFWNKESIKSLSEKLNKNLIFTVRYYGFGNHEVFINKEEHSDRLVPKNLRVFIVSQKKGIYKDRDFYYIPSTKKVKIETETADYLSVHFRNLLNKIVVVKYNINDEDIYKTFQYNNKNGM